MGFLPTGKPADELRIGGRKLDAVAIPSSELTGKWLFPRHEPDLRVYAPIGLRSRLARGRHKGAHQGRRRCRSRCLCKGFQLCFDAVLVGPRAIAEKTFARPG